MPGRVEQFDESTSTSLIVGAREQLPEAWDRVNRIYGPVVYRWCREAGVGEQDAVDLVQEVFRAVIRNLSKFEHRRRDPEAAQRGSFRCWIWTITRNKIRDYWRQASTRPKVIGGTDLQQTLLQVPCDPGEPSDEQLRGPLTLQVLKLIQTEFETTTWTAFWWVTVDGRAIYDVANELGVSLGAVRQAKYRVLRRLREVLQEVD